MRIALDPDKFYVIANNLALDFINTVDHDLTLENLLSWTVAVGLIKESGADELCKKWEKGRLGKVSSFRSRLRKAVIELIDKKKLPAAEIGWINKILQEQGGYAEISQTPGGFSKSNKIDLSEPNKIRIPITESFVDMICYGRLELIRKCERAECILYFYDTTKNHKRRWCSMAICGNRAKVAKFYQKQRSKPEAGEAIAE